MVCIKVRAPPLTIPMPIGAIAHDAAMYDPFGLGAASAWPIYEISYKFGVQWDEAEDRKQPVRRHCRGHRSQRHGCAWAGVGTDGQYLQLERLYRRNDP